MRRCPACGMDGILLHSVCVRAEALAAKTTGAGGEPPTFSQCQECSAVFANEGAEGLVAQPSAALQDPTLWIVPPWKDRAHTTSFEKSWDVIEAFYELEAVKRQWLRPLLVLVGELRQAGFDRQLRAGQSLNSLGLSRSLRDGLRPEQSHLFLNPHADGTLVVEGTVAGSAMLLGPLEARLSPSLRAAIEALARVEID